MRGGRGVCLVAPLSLQESCRCKRLVTARAPSTMLRMVPLPRYRGGGCNISSFSRCECIRVCRHATIRKPVSFPPLQRREAERRKRVHWSPLRRRRTKACLRTRRAPSLFSPAQCRSQSGGALALRRPTAVMRRRFDPPTRPGPRFLESPGANGRTLPGASAASTSQSGQAPDGTMPRTARIRGV